MTSLDVAVEFFDPRAEWLSPGLPPAQTTSIDPRLAPILNIGATGKHKGIDSVGISKISRRSGSL